MTTHCESCPFTACPACDYQPTTVTWTTPGGTKRTRTFDTQADANHYRNRITKHDPNARVNNEGDQ